LVLTIPRKPFASLKALLTILGCLVFLFSIILPFYYASIPNLDGAEYVYYWSFKADYRGGFFTLTVWVIVNHFWFFNYWFSDIFSIRQVSLIALAMFTIQALVLAFGIASIQFKRRIMLAAPVCLSIVVLALMLYIGEILSYGIYQLGYYLVFPSLALFLSAFILNEVTKKQQTKDSISL